MSVAAAGSLSFPAHSPTRENGQAIQRPTALVPFHIARIPFHVARPTDRARSIHEDDVLVRVV